MAVLCEDCNEPTGSLKAICKSRGCHCLRGYQFSRLVNPSSNMESLGGKTMEKRENPKKNRYYLGIVHHKYNSTIT
ncbi:hypothetical protein ANN_01789 [Periplaneta americana]|uniref:Uncharacterized protein n=1 Tax=Periplaneta americana TaxID=6978 RepID=A0ABQ8TVM3_PERAM|nr:hypothetical protein ANN_01789 [Periplaneta americana]